MDFETLTSLLSQKQLSISAAESLTTGNFQTQLAATKNASQVYPGGFITYSTDTKVKLLGIDPLIIKQHGVVSSSTAQAMALNTQQKLTVDIALGFTGNAGPAGIENEPVGTVWIGIAFLDHLFANQYHFNGEPGEIIQQTCQAGCNLIAELI
ncbi:competence protein ComA [Paucilactobacillus hokkaidonensis JCM 18461]|uniref:Competence protein ComA n=2 Tax=Paucilactobacillus hokkaidonensis TaxID=1193095 RepID=A0A0A1GTK9_9LACO|nr:CinA family protein [Paucilactobacillus hokkaidonensis]KRO10152.1 competence damage-inducible protein A [Paucilactobacillus hokkaidonensis]BAP85335.1 competence protein ComA [Paucilactobacillus hokkaidonensis JCM 18461]